MQPGPLKDLYLVVGLFIRTFGVRTSHVRTFYVAPSFFSFVEAKISRKEIILRF